MIVKSNRADEDDLLIDLIYDVAFDSSLWAPLLEKLADRANAQPANFLQMNISDGRGFGMAARVPEGAVDAYFRDWSGGNVIGLQADPDAYRVGWKPFVLRDIDIIDQRDLQMSSYWNEFLVPLDAHNTLILELSLRGNDIATINLARPSRMGHFEDNEIAEVARFHRHLIRAERVQYRLGGREAEQNQLDALLRSSAQATFFLAEDNSLLRCSAPAEALMQRGILRTKGSKLVAGDSASDDAFQRALRVAWAGGAPLPVMLSQPSSSAFFSASIARLGERALSGALARRCLVVSIRSLAPSDNAHTLSVAYALTPAEADLALSLKAGGSLRDIADRRGVSINTVRNQLASVFDKTGCRRQQDLVRLLASRFD